MSQNEIVSETNYYPFGLVHKGYNELVTTTSIGEQWKYQGQERTFDLGLNTDQWKYRVSDPSIGRFWQIDPLAEDYVYNATYAFQENKLGLGIELEGAELNPFPWIVNDATKNPNGIGAHAIGFGQGVVSSVEGTIEAISNPVQTFSAMGELISPGLNPTKIAAGQVIVDGADKILNGNGLERGEVLGGLAMAVVGAKGTTAVTKAASSAVKANTSVKVFRVYGGDSGPSGKSYTTINPKDVPNFRDAAGLPSGGAFGTNTARFVIEGSVKNKNILVRRKALPLDGNNGGLPEIKVNDLNNVKIKNVSGINPEY